MSVLWGVCQIIFKKTFLKKKGCISKKCVVMGFVFVLYNST